MDSFDKTVEMTESPENVREAGTEELPFTIHRTDPYGFYKVQCKKIALPKELSGVYTSPNMAIDAVNLYIENLKKYAKEEEVKADGQRTTQKSDGNRPTRAKGR